MGKTILNGDIIKILKREVEAIREQNNIVNLILRNDVFALLDAQECTVLYFPLKDTIEGFRTVKYVDGKNEQFIYINTAMNEDILVFTAAHELGHLINIDGIVCDELKLEDCSRKMREDIIDRFAAELLMDRDTFNKLFIIQIKKYVDEEGIISAEDMVKTIVYLMDTFMVPYDSVVRRLCEINKISEAIRDLLLDKKVISQSIIEKTIEEGKYRRLKPTNIKSFGDLPLFLEKLDTRGEISENRLLNIMNLFGIKEFDETSLSKVENIQLEKGSCNE